MKVLRRRDEFLKLLSQSKKLKYPNRRAYSAVDRQAKHQVRIFISSHPVSAVLFSFTKVFSSRQDRRLKKIKTDFPYIHTRCTLLCPDGSNGTLQLLDVAAKSMLGEFPINQSIVCSFEM